MCCAPEKAIISASTSAFPSATISNTSLDTVGGGPVARAEVTDDTDAPRVATLLDCGRALSGEDDV